jgi:homoserine kinase
MEKAAANRRLGKKLANTMQDQLVDRYRASASARYQKLRDKKTINFLS